MKVRVVGYLYYDRSGRGISSNEWGAKFEDGDYKSVASTTIDDEVEVSTVWLGLDHGWGDRQPLIFETMIFGGEHDQDQWRYTTEKEAADSHQMIVAILRSGGNPSDHELDLPATWVVIHGEKS